MALSVAHSVLTAMSAWSNTHHHSRPALRLGVAHLTLSGSCVGQMGLRVPAHVCGAVAARWRPLLHGLWSGRALGAPTGFECSVELQVGAIRLR